MKKNGLIAGLAAAGCLLLAGPVAAQQLSYTANVIKATPNSPTGLVIDIFVSGAEPVAGFNFAVRVSSTDAAKLDLAAATSTSPQDNAEFDYQFHTLVRTGVTVGTITGDVTELRGILYPNSSTFTAFNANALTKVATITVPVQANATGEIRLDLVRGIDNNVGFPGISTASGVSQLPPNETRPFGDVKRLLVNDPQVLVGDFPTPSSNGCTDIGDFLYFIENWQVTTDVGDFLNFVENWLSGCS